LVGIVYKFGWVKIEIFVHLAESGCWLLGQLNMSMPEIR